MGKITKFARSAIVPTLFILVFSCNPAAAEQTEQNAKTAAQAQAQGQPSQNQSDKSAKPDTSSFSEFLDQHPDTEKQLRANPYLINDPNFLSTQPALTAFLAAHPDVKNQLEQSPVDFVRHENAASGAASTASRGVGNAPNNRELGRMDEFLDEHRDVEQQLALNPALINDQSYLVQHHDLALFLSTHPDLRPELAANPGYFSQRENQDHNSVVSVPPSSGNGVAASAESIVSDREREIGSMDQFLDGHRDLKADLQQRPLLINDANYLAQHPELQLYLDAHRRIRQDFSEHPENFASAFKVQPQTVPTAPASDVDGPKLNVAPQNSNVDLQSREATRMAQFLDDHPNIRKDLEKNAWLVNQSKYLKHHKELERFLNEYPQIREKLADNPTYFQQRRNAVENAASGDETMRPFHMQFNNIDLELMNRFLEKHKRTAKELDSDPALVTSQHYIDHNKDLRKFFEVHPHVLEEFRQSPRSFMDQENQLRAELR